MVVVGLEVPLPLPAFVLPLLDRQLHREHRKPIFNSELKQVK